MTSVVRTNVPNSFQCEIGLNVHDGICEGAGPEQHDHASRLHQT